MNFFRQTASYQSIQCPDYHRLMTQDEQHTLIDVRTPGEFNGGHLPGAVNIPLNEFAARVNDIPQDRKVVLVCATGNRSGVAADALVRAGYPSEQVYNLVGGTMGWMMQGLPLE